VTKREESLGHWVGVIGVKSLPLTLGGELLIGLSILDNLYVRSARGMREQFRGKYTAIDK